MSAQIQLTEELRALQPRDFLNYIMHKTSGNVYRYIEALSEEDTMQIATTDAMITYRNIVTWIVREFTGRIPGIEISNATFMEQAFWKITNLKICNMCYLESFICEFTDYYYRLDSYRQTIALEMFFNKLPESVSAKVKGIYAQLVKESKIHDTLGARITTIKNWLQRECLQQNAKNEARIKLCCEGQSERIGNYGCNKRKRKTWKKQKYNSKYKKIYKRDNRQNYFRNRKQHRKKYKKEDFCPTNKKNCKCWLCQEEGHYANKCPKKGNKKETAVLKIAYDLGYEPIEDSEIDSEIEIFAYESSSENEQDENR